MDCLDSIASTKLLCFSRVPILKSISSYLNQSSLISSCLDSYRYLYQQCHYLINLNTWRSDCWGHAKYFKSIKNLSFVIDPMRALMIQHTLDESRYSYKYVIVCYSKFSCSIIAIGPQRQNYILKHPETNVTTHYGKKEFYRLAWRWASISASLFF